VNIVGHDISLFVNSYCLKDVAAGFMSKNTVLHSYYMHTLINKDHSFFSKKNCSHSNVREYEESSVYVILLSLNSSHFLRILLIAQVIELCTSTYI